MRELKLLTVAWTRVRGAKKASRAAGMETHEQPSPPGEAGSLLMQRSITYLSCLRPALSGLVALSIAIGSPSCGSWSGNPPSSKVQTGTVPATPGDKQGTVEIVLQGSGTSLRLLESSIPITDRSGKVIGSVNLDSIQIVVSDISLKKDRNDTSAGPVLKGPFVVDLLSNSITPQPGKLTLPEGDYQNISLNLAQKAGNSVQLSGKYVNTDDKSWDLKITLDATDALSLSKEARADIVQVTAGSNQKLAISFKLDQWFNLSGRDVDFSSITDNIFTFDASATGDKQKLREAFLSNVKAAMDFEKITDKNDDDDDDDRRWDWDKFKNGG